MTLGLAFSFLLQVLVFSCSPHNALEAQGMTYVLSKYLLDWIELNEQKGIE